MTEVWAKLTKLCSAPMHGAMTTSLTLTPVGTLLTDLKLGKGTIHLPLSMASTAPSPTPINMLIRCFMEASGNEVHNSTVDFVADFATVTSEAFFGAGTINGLKRILINEAYGSVDIYSNGAGGFYTSGKDVNIKTGKALINMALLSSAEGVGDVIKTRTATITIIGEQTSDMQHLVGFASINMNLQTASNGDLTVFGKPIPPGITIHSFTNAIGNIANVELNLNGALVWDHGFDPRSYTTFRARIIFDATDGNVYSQRTTTGALVERDELTDWINAKTEIYQFPNLQLRATRTAGTMPTFGQQTGLWLDFVTGLGGQPQVLEWQNELVASFERLRTTTLLIELSEDAGATILASNSYTIKVEREINI